MNSTVGIFLLLKMLIELLTSCFCSVSVVDTFLKFFRRKSFLFLFFPLQKKSTFSLSLPPYTICSCLTVDVKKNKQKYTLFDVKHFCVNYFIHGGNVGPGVFKNVVCLRQLITSLSPVYSAITWVMFQSSYHNQGKCNISCYQFDMPRFYEWVGIETEKCTKTFVQLISRRTKSLNLVTLRILPGNIFYLEFDYNEYIGIYGCPKKKVACCCLCAYCDWK